VATTSRKSLNRQSANGCPLAFHRKPARHIRNSGGNARDIVERGLLLKATGVILVHIHPGRAAQPSGANTNFTKHLKINTRTVGIRFVAYVIVTDDAYYNMMNERLI